MRWLTGGFTGAYGFSLSLALMAHYIVENGLKLRSIRLAKAR